MNPMDPPMNPMDPPMNPMDPPMNPMDPPMNPMDPPMNPMDPYAMTMTMAMAMSRVWTAWTMSTACAARDQSSTAWTMLTTAHPSSPRRRRITELLSTLSMLLIIGPALRALLTLSMLSTLLT